MNTVASDWNVVRRQIVGNAASIGFAVAMYGVSFGALGTTTGLSIPQTMALSLLMFTGASQFTLVSTLASGGTALTAVIASWLMGTRNAAYSMRMTPILKTSGPGRLVAVQLTIDESTAMGLAQDEEAFRRPRFSLGILGNRFVRLLVVELGDIYRCNKRFSNRRSKVVRSGCRDCCGFIRVSLAANQI
jgi:predicted branched-subunit amino acid permease